LIRELFPGGGKKITDGEKKGFEKEVGDRREKGNGLGPWPSAWRFVGGRRLWPTASN
jgi:hypothetical protein